MRILDVGCGINKKAGAIGVDRNPASRADVIADLDHFPYPFRDSSFDSLQAVHVIEHLSDVIRSMEEFHRLVRGGGEVLIVTPHYTDFSSFCDPTHRWHLNSFSMRYFGKDNAGYGYYSTVRFTENSVRVKLLALWRWLGFEWLVNTFPRYRRFWEHYLCYVVRGKVIEWRLQVIKGDQHVIGRALDALRDARRRRTWDRDLAAGRRGEDLAHRYLRREGFIIVARNYRLASGEAEADLIAREGEDLVIVEVKTRETAEFGAPERAVNPEKQRHLIRVGREYARRTDTPWEHVRFDIVTVVMGKKPEITLLRAAFRQNQNIHGC